MMRIGEARRAGARGSGKKRIESNSCAIWHRRSAYIASSTAKLLRAKGFGVASGLLANETENPVMWF